jgi:hypothetical protein
LYFVQLCIYRDKKVVSFLYCVFVRRL